MQSNFRRSCFRDSAIVRRIINKARSTSHVTCSCKSYPVVHTSDDRQYCSRRTTHTVHYCTRMPYRLSCYVVGDDGPRTAMLVYSYAGQLSIVSPGWKILSLTFFLQVTESMAMVTLCLPNHFFAIVQEKNTNLLPPLQYQCMG